MLSNDNDNQNDLLQNLTRRSAVDPVKKPKYAGVGTCGCGTSITLENCMLK